VASVHHRRGCVAALRDDVDHGVPESLAKDRIDLGTEVLDRFVKEASDLRSPVPPSSKTRLLTATRWAV
jgi:hypothetical protein